MLRNGFYNFLGTGVRIGLGIITVPVLISLLGTNGFGIYSIIMSVIAFAVLSEWSISLTLNVFLSQDMARGSEDEAALIGTTLLSSLIVIFGLAILTTIILWFVAPFLPKILKDLSDPESNDVVVGCRLLIFIVWSRLFHQYFIGIEQAHNKYALLNFITTLFNILQTIGILIAAYLYKNILMILIVQGIVSSLFIVVHAVVCYKMDLLSHFSFKIPISVKNIKSVMTYCSRIWLGTIGSVIFNQGDRLVIASIMAPSAVGVYSALTSLVYQINSFSAAPVQPIMSIVGQLSASSESQWVDQPKLLIAVRKALLLNILIAVSMGSLIILFAPELVKLFFKQSYGVIDQTVLHLNLLTLIYTLYSCNAVGFYILYAVKQEMINTVVVLICGLLALSFIALFTSRYGLMGAIVGNSAYILTLFLLYKGLREIRISLNDIVGVVQIPLLLLVGTSLIAFTTQDLFVRCTTAFTVISCLSFFGFLRISTLMKINIDSH